MKLIEMLSKVHELVENNVAWYIQDEDHAKVVKNMNARGLFVYHIIESTYNLGGEYVMMTSYCYISEKDDLNNTREFFRNFKDGYCYANVINHTWGIDELGSIAFKVINNKMKRVG